MGDQSGATYTREETLASFRAYPSPPRRCKAPLSLIEDSLVECRPELKKKIQEWTALNPPSSYESLALSMEEILFLQREEESGVRAISNIYRELVEDHQSGLLAYLDPRLQPAKPLIHTHEKDHPRYKQLQNFVWELDHRPCQMHPYHPRKVTLVKLSDLFQDIFQVAGILNILRERDLVLGNANLQSFLLWNNGFFRPSSWDRIDAPATVIFPGTIFRHKKNEAFSGVHTMVPCQGSDEWGQSQLGISRILDPTDFERTYIALYQA